MLAIPEPYILIRVPGELPKGLRLRTHEFRAGWNLAWSLTTERLEDKIRAHGWKFIKIANRSMSGAVGDYFAGCNWKSTPTCAQLYT